MFGWVPSFRAIKVKWLRDVDWNDDIDGQSALLDSGGLTNGWISETRADSFTFFYNDDKEIEWTAGSNITFRTSVFLNDSYMPPIHDNQPTPKKYVDDAIVAHHTFSSLEGKPTTLLGYGIADSVSINTFQDITVLKNFTGGLSFPVGADSTFVRNPAGGGYTSNSSSLIGRVKISLPTNYFPSTMLYLKVLIYNYTTNTSIELHLAGYAYAVGEIWYNCTSQINGVNRVLPISYGKEGNKPTIWIGDVTTVWSYPKIVITEVLTGHSNTNPSIWSSGWSIDITNASMESISVSQIAATPVLQNGDQDIIGVKSFTSGVKAVVPTKNISSNYSFILSDLSSYILANSTATITLTIQPDTSVNFPIGSAISIMRVGSGAVTFSAGSGVTLRVPNGSSIFKQYTSAVIIKISANQWVLDGNLI